MKKKSFLVTGGTGFLGSHLIPLLLESGHHVRVLARNITKDQSENKKIEYIKGSINDLKSLVKASKGVNGIFHLAAVVLHSRLPHCVSEVKESVIDGTKNIMKAAKENKCRVVYVSTSGVVGCSKDPKFVANDKSLYCYEVVKHWPYYSSKIEAEIWAKQYAKDNKLELIILRPTMIFGPGDDRFRSTSLILSYLHRTIPVVFDGGLSFVDVRDVAKVAKTAMMSGKAGESYLLGSINLTLEEFFILLEGLTKVPRPTLKLPYLVTYPAVTTLDLFNRKIKGKYNPSFDPVKAEMATHYWFISSDKAKKELGFNPIDPKQTILDTLKWIKENGPKNVPTNNIVRSKL